jgi:ribosome-binding factor A
MTRPKSSRQRRPVAPVAGRVPRTARLNQLLREIIAGELERIGDDRLEFVTITTIDVDADLNRAIVSFDSLDGAGADASILQALADYRVKLQSAVNRQLHVRKTPILHFQADEVIRSAERIEAVLRDLPPVREQPELEAELAARAKAKADRIVAGLAEDEADELDDDTDEFDDDDPDDDSDDDSDHDKDAS